VHTPRQAAATPDPAVLAWADWRRTGEGCPAGVQLSAGARQMVGDLARNGTVPPVDAAGASRRWTALGL